MMVVVIPQKEHAVLEVKVLQSIGFLGGSMVETKIKVPDDSLWFLRLESCCLRFGVCITGTQWSLNQKLFVELKHVLQ